jgi:hypothetical protein
MLDLVTKYQHNIKSFQVHLYEQEGPLFRFKAGLQLQDDHQVQAMEKQINSIHKIGHGLNDPGNTSPPGISNWRKSEFVGFSVMFHKLFDLNAQDYYNVDNPVVKILLPKMNYGKEERIKVIRQAYKKIKYSIC